MAPVIALLARIGLFAAWKVGERVGKETRRIEEETLDPFEMTLPEDAPPRLRWRSRPPWKPG